MYLEMALSNGPDIFRGAIVCAVLGVAGNSLTAIVLLASKTMRRHSTTPFLLSMAISDLIFCGFNLPLTAIRYGKAFPYLPTLSSSHVLPMLLIWSLPSSQCSPLPVKQSNMARPETKIKEYRNNSVPPPACPRYWSSRGGAHGGFKGTSPPLMGCGVVEWLLVWQCQQKTILVCF